MFDFHASKTVEAHGEKWVTLRGVSHDDTHTYYLAARADKPFPTEVVLIQVSREWEEEQRKQAVAEYLKQQQAPKAAE